MQDVEAARALAERAEAGHIPSPMTSHGDLQGALAKNLRQFRAQRGWTLGELAERSHISRAMIVQVEGGRTNPSIGTICQLADALGVPVQSLIEVEDDRRVRVVAAQSTAVLWKGRGGSYARLLGGTASRERVEVWEWRLATGVRVDAPAHPRGTRELIAVRSGTLKVRVGDETAEGGPGDLVIFEADADHQYAAGGRGAVTFTMIVQLPSGAPRSARARP